MPITYISPSYEGTQKEESKYAPSSQSETAGSGLPDQENMAHEFADSSFLLLYSKRS